MARARVILALVFVAISVASFGACSRLSPPIPSSLSPASKETPPVGAEPRLAGPSAEPAVSAVPAPSAGRVVRYLALGDSFTIGTGSSPQQAFPTKLAERWRAAGREVVLENPARNAFSTADVLAEETPLIAIFRPTLITLAVGANDIVRHRSEATYRDTVRQILALAKSSGAVLVGLPQPDWAATPAGARFRAYDVVHARIGRSNRILREEVERAGGRWVDLSPLMERQAKARLVAPDGLHPSAAAHAEWAEVLAAALPAAEVP